jgi:hypothetical protein
MKELNRKRNRLQIIKMKEEQQRKEKENIEEENQKLRREILELRKREFNGIRKIMMMKEKEQEYERKIRKLEKKLEKKDEEIEKWFEINIENSNKRNEWERKYKEEIWEKELIIESLRRIELENETDSIALQYLTEDSDW